MTNFNYNVYVKSRGTRLLYCSEIQDRIGDLIVAGFSDEEIVEEFSQIVANERQAMLETAQEAESTPLYP